MQNENKLPAILGLVLISICQKALSFDIAVYFYSYWPYERSIDGSRFEEIILDSDFFTSEGQDHTQDVTGRI